MKRSLESLRAWEQRTRAKKLANRKLRKPLPKVNRRRLAKRRAREFGPQAERCRTLICCGCFSDWYRGGAWRSAASRNSCDPHHVRSRGAGGLDADCVPLCRDCHTEIHTIGRAAFEQKHHVDLRAIAARLHEEIGK